MTSGGKTTAGIAFDADATALKAALVAIDDGLVAGDWDVTGVASAWVVEFKATQGAAPKALMVGDGASLAGGAGVVKTVTVANSVVGVAATATSTTIGITFSPALGAGVYVDSAVVTFKPCQIDVKIGDGELKYTENTQYKYDLDRGVLDTVRMGDDQPMDVSLNFTFEHVTTGTGEVITPVDAVKGIGGAAEWVSSSSDLCEPYAGGPGSRVHPAVWRSGQGNPPLPGLSLRKA